MENNLLKKLEEFEHHYSPLHLYCRLIELGLEKREARRLAEIYDLGIYQEILEELKESERFK